ncbi:MAG TPA: hypothetical protein VG674_13810, partial [Amycolatopsis sp.]|nr:hypothetical protein [Amycolatopsis sp.]
LFRVRHSSRSRRFSRGDILFGLYLCAVLAALTLAVVAPEPFAALLRSVGGGMLELLRQMARGLPKPFPI